jgi:MSHA biogenesis protein MshP
MSAIHLKSALTCVAPLPQRQRGASLITAVFLITALAVLGAMTTRIITLDSTGTVNEWLSAQSLYAAESGIDWGARYIEDNNTCTPYSTSNRVVVTGRSWFDLDITCVSVDNFNLYTIISTGKTGGSLGNPMTQRELQVLYSPSS